MSKGAETLSERIHAVEFKNWNLLKCYDRLIDKVSLQEGNMHAIKIMYKDETVSLLDKSHTGSSMRALKHNTAQKTKTLQKAVVKRSEKTEKLPKLRNKEKRYKDRIQPRQYVPESRVTYQEF